jgi:hypothetical protein
MFILKYFFLVLLLGYGFFSFAQSKQLIKNVYATYSVHLPGNVAVDENGNAIEARDTVYVIYIESAAKINWTTAWRNHQNYELVTHMIKSDSFEAGVDKANNEKLILKTSKANKLWELRLVPSENKMEPSTPVLHGEILIQGNYKEKNMLKKISKQIELIATPSV